ncbi:hypothetical protein Vadar_025807 [Vaccinium darrowii]|uniref:Uncharacterized protein n=1 Tax=Vaccinium darrowii TaxID=229202 RepID=A0ACB7X3V6_9ERIC|nr:hypothetical protein Vadar_025807 [Vaccinium darrowii]
MSGEKNLFNFTLPPPPPASNSDSSAYSIVAIVPTLIIFCVIIYAFTKMLTRASVATVPPTINVVQVWTMDAPTMERFLQDLAKERPVRFTAQQLCSFTNNYSKVLGSGGFGIVYKGQLPNGVKIAVKVLKRSLIDKRAEGQFMAEVSTIGRTYHINLVRLYGFSYDPFMSALIYEYMENGSLDKYLFGDDTQGIDWNKLPEIAIGTARVGRRRNAKVGSTDSLDWFPKHVWDKYEKGELAKMTLTCGIEEKDSERAQRMALVALWCVQDSPEARPPMSVVVKMLEGGVEIMAPPKPFHYLFSVGVNVLNAPTCNSSDYSIGYGTNSYWYKEQTTTIMAKYEIQIASSS